MQNLIRVNMNLPINTIIETNRCKLRSTKKEDISFIFSATRYKGFNDGMLWDAPKNEAELIATYEDGVTKAWYERQSYGFTICDKFNNEPLGRINIRKDLDKVWFIGFWMHPEQQEKGYMTESVKAILELGFITLSAEKIEAFHALWNKKSEKVLKAVGMNFIEYIPQGFMKKGKWVEENKLGITKEEWNKFKN
jgi:ribosomal-protein-alanine N-acetyltransferase